MINSLLILKCGLLALIFTLVASCPRLVRDAAFLSSYSATETRATELWCGNRSSGGRNAPCLSKATNRAGEMRSKVVEVRGWLLNDPYMIIDENEVAFDLLLDWDWQQASPASEHAEAISTLTKINSSVTPHNMIHFGRGSSGNLSSKIANRVWGGARAAALHIEINGWGPSDRAIRARPLPTTSNGQAQFEGWIISTSMPAGKEQVLWPFDPFHPPATNGDTDLNAGDYVRMTGMLWEDSAHANEGGNGGGDGKNAKGCWKSGSHDLGDQGRGWFEIHPVDFLAIIDPPAHSDTFEMFAICDEGTLDRTIRPSAPRPGPEAMIGYDEFIDSGFSLGRSYNQDRVTVLNDGIRVQVEVGDRDPRGKKFKGAYRVYWQE